MELRPGYAKASEGLNKATLALSQPRVEPPEPERVPIMPPLNSILPAGSPPIDSLRARYLGRDIARTANDLRQHFENTIIPLLTHMRRLVIEGRGGTSAFREQQREYRSACQHNSELRRTLRMLCLRLFATEELSRTSRQTECPRPVKRPFGCGHPNDKRDRRPPGRKTLEILTGFTRSSPTLHVARIACDC